MASPAEDFRKERDGKHGAVIVSSLKILRERFARDEARRDGGSFTGGGRSLPGRRVPGDLLLDGAEQAAAFSVEHLEAHAVAEFEEGCRRLALGDGFERALLRDAGRTHAAVGIRNRSRSDYGAGPEGPGPGGVRDQPGNCLLYTSPSPRD